jgi:hypothetical protein
MYLSVCLHDSSFTNPPFASQFGDDDKNGRYSPSGIGVGDVDVVLVV